VTDDEVLEHKAKMRAGFVVEDLCNDPDVWLTHGCPGEDKLDRIGKRIAQEILKSLKDSWPVPMPRAKQ
jgi:hypothetical protein